MPTSTDLAQQLTDLDQRAADLAQQQQQAVAAAQQARAALATGNISVQDTIQAQICADTLTAALADLRAQRAALAAQLDQAKADEATDAHAARYASYADEANAAYADVVAQFDQFESYMQDHAPALWDATQRFNVARNTAKHMRDSTPESERAAVTTRAAQHADLALLTGTHPPLDNGRAFAHLLLGWLELRQQQQFSAEQAERTRQRYARERKAAEVAAARRAELERLMAERQAEIAQQAAQPA